MTVTIGWEYDDGGRAASGRKGSAGDCVVRAIAIVSGAYYDEVYRVCANHNQKYCGQRSARNGVDKRAYEKAMREFGLTKVPLPRGSKPTFSEAHERYGNCVASTTGHLAALKDGALRDTVDWRTYVWLPDGEVRERKAMSVFVPSSGEPSC